ncbi:hypothetical protein JOF53_005584 [Crossiella equi]|uniref:Uncharacterized protein n=1 Tax=Crossiella equi TaxID=130796 RepID=A0ABS5AK01_9PSEU|nr:DUF6153 family protein [Crossiella equi]MBP2476712.1 hypothetical protein [Crossiella equi]
MLLVFSVSLAVLVMHQITHPGHGGHHQAAAHGHQGHGLVRAAPDAPPPGDHGGLTATHLCAGLVVTALGLLALVLLGWQRRDRGSEAGGAGGTLVRATPRAPPPKLFDLSTLGVLRL